MVEKLKHRGINSVTPIANDEICDKINEVIDSLSNCFATVAGGGRINNHQSDFNNQFEQFKNELKQENEKFNSEIRAKVEKFIEDFTPAKEPTEQLSPLEKIKQGKRK